uniref:E2F-related protein n=1 Tax=Oryza coarctata TaxID=77588 RepID=A0A8K0YC11_ORYCO|nr:E2F-related protein [Oryza coarctata]
MAFLLVWFYFSPAPCKMGYAAAVERFLKLMAMVWAGSQVTKILQAGGRLRWFTVRFNFKSEGKAFATIFGFCFAVAALLFFGLTILWA